MNQGVDAKEVEQALTATIDDDKVEKISCNKTCAHALGLYTSNDGWREKSSRNEHVAALLEYVGPKRREAHWVSFTFFIYILVHLLRQDFIVLYIA